MEINLKIDVDTNFNEFYNEFLKRILTAKVFLSFKIKALRIFKTRRGYHFYLKLNLDYNIPNVDYVVLFLQLYFLDDYKRSIINFRRVLHNVENWNVLFENKNGYVRIYDKELTKIVINELEKLGLME